MRTYSLSDLPGIPRRFDRLFVQRVRMARFGPDIHFAVSQEIEAPYRVARCVILHLEPFRTGLVIGWYGEGLPDPEDANAVSEALRRAVNLRPPTRQELDDFNDTTKLHGPGQPGGLRFSATRGLTNERRSGRRVAAADDAGAGQ